MYTNYANTLKLLRITLVDMYSFITQHRNSYLIFKDIEYQLQKYYTSAYTRILNNKYSLQNELTGVSSERYPAIRSNIDSIISYINTKTNKFKYLRGAETHIPHHAATFSILFLVTMMDTVAKHAEETTILQVDIFYILITILYHIIYTNDKEVLIDLMEVVDNIPYKTVQQLLQMLQAVHVKLSEVKVIHFKED